MNNDEIKRKVVQIINKYVEDDWMTDFDKSFMESGKIDSYTLLDILMDIEEQFGICFDLEANFEEVFFSVNTICSYISEKVSDVIN